MGGWIKIHRKILSKSWWSKPKYVHLWIHLLLKANHSPKEFLWNGKEILIQRGQFITGRKELSNETGISQTTIENILKTFEIGQQIGQQKTNKYRLITVINYCEYQDVGQDIGQQADNKRTTNGQQMDTNKNDKNDKNDKNSSNEEQSKTPEELQPTKPKKEPRKDIDFLLKGIESAISIIDENKKVRRQWAKLFLDSKIPEIYRRRHGREPTQQECIDATVLIFKLAHKSEDKFIKTNSSSLKWVYNNIGKILNSKSANAPKVAFIS